MEKIMQFEIARLSSKGQFVIPGKVRKLLGLRTGTKLSLFTDGENILMRPISAPDLSAFRKLASEAKKTALNAKKMGAKK
jgi:antitoxin PrlF